MWKKRNAIQAANIEGNLSGLTHCLAEQEVCKKALVDFLDSKRLVFPRFYFVSEADLLDILSNGSNPKVRHPTTGSDFLTSTHPNHSH